MQRSPPGPLTFFIDRSLGNKVVPEALRSAGAQVERHDDHFAKDCPDEVWLAEVGRRGWIVLAKDKRIRRRPAERKAIENASVAAFVLTSGEMSGARMAAAFVAARHRMEQLVHSYTRPLLATVSPSGQVTVVVGVRQSGVRR